MSAALAALLLCQLAGEILVRALHLPVPGPVLGPVLGMALLVAGLVLRGRAPPPALGAAADALLGNLRLLFVPAGVGVMLYRHALRNGFHRAPPLGTATGHRHRAAGAGVAAPARLRAWRCRNWPRSGSISPATRWRR